MIQDTIIRLVVIEESANDAEVILNSLRKARFPIRPKHVEDAEDLETVLNEQEWDLIVTVPAVGDFDVTQVCELVANSKQDIPVIVLCDPLEEECMAGLFSAGASQAIPRGNDTCLQISVRRELNNLDERRQRRRVEQLYRETQRHNMMLLETSRDAIAYVHDGMHIHANPAYMDMFGFKSMEELEGLPVMDLVAPDNHTKFKEFMREYMSDVKQEDREIQLTGLRNHKKFPLKMELSQAIYENERCIQIVIRDESDSRELEKKLKEAARRDQLTQLYNRQYFLQLLEKAIAKAMETHVRGVLLYLALDNFSSIRERVGIAASDPIIVNIAEALKQHTENSVIARFGESVFTLLFSDKDVNFATEEAEKLRAVVESVVTELPDQSVITTASIGIAPVMASSGTPQNVLKDAHEACQSAGKAGGNQAVVYKAVIKNEDQIDTSDVAKMIETAIEEKRLSLVYQPIVSLRGETEAIYDVYLRMVDVEGHAIPPGKLFSAAEQAGMSAQLDKWVLKEAVRVLMQQRQAGKKLRFFIRFSDQAVRDDAVLFYINKLLKATQLPGDHLVIQISESIALSQVKHAKMFIGNLQKMRCKTALEHFGTGLNSATTLNHLPVDYVKLDSSYSKGLSSDQDNQKAVSELVQLAHSLNKVTVAEAVEDANSLTVLWQCEVDYAQGHYIQEPSEALDYEFEE